MGRRKIKVAETAAESIAAISLYIESKGMIATDDIYDYFLKMADERKSFALCREPSRAMMGYKCVTYKRKYTIVFYESLKELIIYEFISSKMIYW
jgi:hypothetical protein